ncbi:hypothetical protein [Actinoplanes sp. N902-109]|uniref:hypothetical protein n=1 Tax=Actinoplanes sp. (strain N902-109) TaxID=649831 RepID=UPI0003A1E46C|nr:hypothetical protein [Actinoplanes sp. N902-109]
MPVDEAAPVRTAAQWLVVAAGAIGAALVAGLQLGDVGKLTGTPFLLVAAAAAVVSALAVVGRVIARASAVLVIRRITVSDLLAAETAEQARATDIHPVSDSRPPHRDTGSPAGTPWIPRQWDRLRGRLLQPDVIREPAAYLRPLLGQIRANREWLFVADGRSTSDLSNAYTEAAQRARAGDQVAAARAAELDRRLTGLCLFARGELTRSAYRRLSTTITGWPGWLFVVSVALFAITLNWPVAQAPRVKEPYPLTVVLTGSAGQLKGAGLATGCRPASRLNAVALAGTTTEPLVVTDAQGSCPASRFTVTADIGVPLPSVPANR